jgi:hypothetical protein
MNRKKHNTATIKETILLYIKSGKINQLINLLKIAS